MISVKSDKLVLVSVKCKRNSLAPFCHSLPESCHSVNQLLNVGSKMYLIKYLQRSHSLITDFVLSAGQGVILDRSVFSDTVFADVNYDEGTISPEGISWECIFWKVNGYRVLHKIIVQAKIFSLFRI